MIESIRAGNIFLDYLESRGVICVQVTEEKDVFNIQLDHFPYKGKPALSRLKEKRQDNKYYYFSYDDSFKDELVFRVMYEEDGKVLYKKDDFNYIFESDNYQTINDEIFKVSVYSDSSNKLLAYQKLERFIKDFASYLLNGDD